MPPTRSPRRCLGLPPLEGRKLWFVGIGGAGMSALALVARAGAGWLVAEGDESDRSLELLRPRVAVLTNVELDHHATFGSAAEVRELFDRWLAAAPAAVRGDELEPVELELGVPGEHNRRN